MEALIMILLIQVIRVEPLHSPKNLGLHAGGNQSWRREAENSDAATWSNSQAVYDAETGRKYGCHLNSCWRSCKKGEQFVKGEDLCKNDEWCYSDLGKCSWASGCVDAVKLQCYGYGYEPGHFKIGQSTEGTPCPAAFDKYYCDTVTKKSFGCSDSESSCWRSCHERERNCKKGKNNWCPVIRAGRCSKDNRCIVATQLPCSPLTVGSRFFRFGEEATL